MTLEQLTRDYLQKLAAHDLPGCMRYFDETSTIEGRAGVHRGREAIQKWHQERLDAAFSIVSLTSLKEKGQETTTDLVITSNRLAGRRIEQLPMRINLRFEGDKVSAAKLSVRVGAGLKSLFGR